MHLQLTEPEKRFLASVDAFLDEHWPAELRRVAMPGPRRALAEQAYVKALAALGWLTGEWPTELGGLGWSSRLRWLFDRAAADALAPDTALVGPELIGPMLIEHGRTAQRDALLPAISAAVMHWCLALDDDPTMLEAGAIEATLSAAPDATVNKALPAAAAGEAPSWRLNGRKCWLHFDAAKTPAEQVGICLLARVEDSADLVVLLIDRAAPGVRLLERAMIGDIAGVHSVYEVTFTEVLLTEGAILGEVGQGRELWEELQRREMALAGRTQRNRVLLAALRQWTEGGEADDGALWADEDFRAELHATEVELASLAAFEQRLLAAETTLQTEQKTEPETHSATGVEFAEAARLGLAVRGAELGQRLADLQVSALGYHALPFVDFTAIDNEGSIGPEFAQPALLGMLSDRARGAISVSGEHLKNVIAKSVLALPQDDSLAPNSAPDQ